MRHAHRLRMRKKGRNVLRVLSRCLAGLVTALLVTCPALPALAAVLPNAAAPVLSRPDGKISVTFANTDLRSAFTLLADLAGLNVVLDPALTGEVSVSLRQVEIAEAIEIVARAGRVTATTTDDLLMVSAKTPEADTEETQVRVYSLQYADPGKVAEMAAIAAPGLRVSSEETAKRIVARGSAAELADFELFLAQFDKAGHQVLIETRVEEVSRQSMKELGLTWNMPTLDTEWDTKLGSLPVSVKDLSATLDALETRGNARLLARPTITAISGEKATIFVGDRVPVVLKGGEQGTERIEYIEAGIMLEIVARIGSDGLITTHVKPQVSSIVDWTPQGLPQVRSRNAETTVRVRDGQPIIIGGLIREEDRRTMAQVPGIGALPIVGALFRSNRNDSTQFETVIILTPRLIDETDRPTDLPSKDNQPDVEDTTSALPKPQGHLLLSVAADIRSPAPGRAELTVGWITDLLQSHWEARLVSPLPTSGLGKWRYGLAWRAEERPWWLRLGAYGVIESARPLSAPSWEIEVAAGVSISGSSGLFAEPCARVVWPIDNATGTVAPLSGAGVLVGVRL